MEPHKQSMPHRQRYGLDAQREATAGSTSNELDVVRQTGDQKRRKIAIQQDSTLPDDQGTSERREMYQPEEEGQREKARGKRAEHPIADFEMDGKRYEIYKEWQQFRNREGKVYTTDNMSYLEQQLSLPEGTLRKNSNKWQKMAELIPVEHTEVQLAGGLYALQKGEQIVLTDNLTAFARNHKIPQTNLADSWNGNASACKGFTRPEERQLAALEKEGIHLQPRKDTQEPSVFELAGKSYELYEDLQQFRSPEGTVYTTNNMSYLEQRLSLPKNTLRQNRNKWKKMTEWIPGERTEVQSAGGLYALQKGEQIVLTDNLTAFARNHKISQTKLSRLWNGGVSAFKGFTRPEERQLADLEKEGIHLQPRKDTQEPSVFELAGKSYELYEDLQQFRSPKGTVYTTNNMSYLEQRLSLPKNTLSLNLHKWQKMTEWIPVEHTEVQSAGGLYALQKGKQVVLTDNLEAFGRNHKISPTNLTKLWNGRRSSSSGWVRPGVEQLKVWQDEGIHLKPRKDQAPEEAADLTAQPTAVGTSRQQEQAPRVHSARESIEQPGFVTAGRNAIQTEMRMPAVTSFPAQGDASGVRGKRPSAHEIAPFADINILSLFTPEELDYNNQEDHNLALSLQHFAAQEMRWHQPLEEEHAPDSRRDLTTARDQTQLAQLSDDEFDRARARNEARRRAP